MSFDNDAKSCYDRIVINLALLISQHLGMPSTICEWYSKFLHTINYHIQLPTLISQQSYNHSDDHPLHGPGQGSRAAPSLWVYISSVVMNCMSRKSNGITFKSPDNKHQFNHIMTGFVDDTNHWINNFDRAIQGNYSTQEMYWNTQTTAQWWEQLLYSTGGKLELPNFFFTQYFGNLMAFHHWTIQIIHAILG